MLVQNMQLFAVDEMSAKTNLLIKET
jgi:hypothetical protein